MVLNVAAPTVKTMSSCRATSFYLAPGVLRYFKNNTVAAVLPDGSWVEIKHRGDIAGLQKAHLTWDGTVLCGPHCQNGLRELRSRIAADGSTVEVWNINDRIIEGRRPEDAAVFALHKWAVTGDTQAVGGVRQLIEAIAPGAPRSVRNALQESALRGEHHAVEVVSAAWRAGLMLNPDQIVEILKHSRIPFRSIPDPRLERLLAGVVATGRNVDALVFISSMIDGSQMLDAGTGQLLARDATTSSVVLHVLALDGNYETRKEVACNSNTLADTLLHLVKDEEESVRRYVAQNSNTPTTALLQLAKDENEYVRRDLASNPNTPAAALFQLSQEGSRDVMVLVAKHRNTPADALEMLAKDRDAAVRREVARNPSTPVFVLEQLANCAVIPHDDWGDRSYGVRSAVAGNLSTPVSVLEQLARDWGESVQSVVAGNPNTPVALLEQLSKDSNRSGWVKSVVASNPNTPVALLEQLSKEQHTEDSGVGVRSAVARNPSTPVFVLEQLSNDRSDKVQRVVASNPNTPVSVLEQLSKDRDAAVRLRVAENPNTPVSVLEQLATSEAVDVKWGQAGDGYGGVRSAVARNLNTPVFVLEQLSKDSGEWVQHAVASNPNTPVFVLEQLSKDSRVDLYSHSSPRFHTDRYEHHAIKNGIPLELYSTSDLAYHDLVQYGAPAADYPDVITTVRDVGRENMSFRFSDDTLRLRHTFTESTVQVGGVDLTPRVVSSPRALTENANYMGNCTVGREGDIRRDETLIIALDDSSSASRATLYNVEIQRGTDGRWDTIGEINSRFNKGVTGEEQSAIKARVNELLSSL